MQLAVAIAAKSKNDNTTRLIIAEMSLNRTVLCC